MSICQNNLSKKTLVRGVFYQLFSFTFAEERDDDPEFYHHNFWTTSQSESQTSSQIHRALTIEEKSGLASRLGDKIRSNFNRPKLR